VAPQQPGGAQVPYQGFKIYEQPAPPDDAVDAAPADNPPATQAQTQTPSPPAEAPVAAPPPVAAKPAPVKAAPPPSRPAPVQAAAAPKPAPKPAPAGPATAAPRSLSAAAPAPATAGGSTFLQIGAYKSQADAEAAWKTFRARHATLLAGHGLDVQRVDLGDKGIWYRARVGGFGDRDVAAAMCDRLKADGGSCFLAR